jgi:hypothetical protein
MGYERSLIDQKDAQRCVDGCCNYLNGYEVLEVGGLYTRILCMKRGNDVAKKTADKVGFYLGLPINAAGTTPFEVGYVYDTVSHRYLREATGADREKWSQASRNLRAMD